MPVTQNRFLDSAHRPGALRAPSRHSPWVAPQAATTRELVVLIENGGIDLNLRPLVDAAVDRIPGASLVISQDMRGAIVAQLREWIRRTTDNLLETAELSLNRYESAAPATYGTVHVLRNSTATFDQLRDRLFAATRAGRVVDLLILTHGSSGYIAADSGIDAARIRSLRTQFGGPLNLRTVTMMSCVGASLNQAWLHAGARASAGTVGNNNLPEPTTYFFWSAWKSGTAFETAVLSAYRRTVDALNSLVRSIPGLGDVDVSTLDLIQSSRPEVAGDGTLTVGTDTLPAAASGMGLVATVLPARAMAMMRQAASSYAISAGRGLSAHGRTFVESWERPLASPGAEGEAELQRRISAAEHLVAEGIAQPLTQAQIDALVCFACGIGKRAFVSSTAHRLLGEGRLAEVPGEIRKWTRVRRGGVIVESDALRARRAAEAELFTGESSAWVVPESREVQQYAYQQNPLAAVGLVEAVEWGLAAGGIVQAGLTSGGRGFTLTYDKAQRLLDARARLEMPGARVATTSYTRRFLSFPQIRAGTAHASLVAEWGGNPYGEIETVVFKKDMSASSEWTLSELRVTVTLLGRVPAGNDPRAWPLTYRYEGSYDPLGNGQFEFEGEIELDAFGGFRWVRPHRVASRSLADWAISGAPEDWVARGPDVASTVPAIPAEQAAYLRQHQPGGS
jgi:GH24 family phage-related lysozyme (muramidase)